MPTTPFFFETRRSGKRIGQRSGDMLAPESSLYIYGNMRYSQIASLLYMKITISNRVKALRSDRGWTQEQLASAVGVSRQSINSIERDRYVPSLPLAMLLAEAFGCSLEEVFTLEKI